jgi:ketopantoate reductase
MQVTILGGTGSLGAYFAYHLVKSSHNVTIIGKENSLNLKQIAETGLTLEFCNETVFVPNYSFGFIGSYKNSILTIKQDLVIVSLKQPSLDIKIANQIMNITDENSVIGVISNGLPFYFLSNLNLRFKAHIEAVDLTGEILQLMHTRKIITIMPIMGSNIVAPGVIKVISPPDKIKTIIGAKFIDQMKLELISKAFDDAQIKSTVSNKISKNLLENLEFSLAVNVMSALLDKHNGQVFQDEENQVYIKYVIEFVNNLGNALGIKDLRDYDIFKSLNISEARYSSMHEDYKNAKVPEIKVIVSAPLELSSYLNLTFPTKPLEIIEELLFFKANNNSVSLEKIQEIYYESELAINITEV